MAKLSGLGHLVVALLALLPWSVAVDITDIFTVQSGNLLGSCDNQMGLLDNWLAESTFSVEVALDAIDRYDSDPNIRKAMEIIFHIKNQGKMSAGGKRRAGFRRVKDELDWVYTFLNADGPYSKDKFWLFCDCTFLESHLPSQPAYDYLGNEIHDDDNDIVPIENVKEYKDALAKEPNARPWWSGAHSALKGYYFTEKGGDYCTASQLAATAHIQELRRPVPTEDAEEVQLASIILCPESFATLRQANYRDANNLIIEGTNLADGVPRSATLLHEMFHAIRGEAFFSGDAEHYDIATCVDLKQDDALSNIENYVFFVAQMYHLFGVPDNNEIWSIGKNWAFKVMGPRNYQVLGAVAP